MEPTSRFYQCLLCHEQTVICSKCDHGQIYCSSRCSALARRKSLKAAGKRYQLTINGKRNHAARQARYEMNLKTNLTHHSSLQVSQCAPIQSLENDTKNTERKHDKSTLICCFCNKPVSFWLRNDFLKQRAHKKIIGLRRSPQAP